MPETNTPLFETECFGYTITHVYVFPTHITFCQKSGRDISVPLRMIASVEEHVYKNEFMILRPTTGRPIICWVRPEGSTTIQPNRAAALCASIREAQHRFVPASGNAGENETPLALPVVEGESVQPKPHSSKIAVSDTR